VVCHGRLRQHAEAAAVLAEARALDPLDAWLRHLDGLPASGDAQTLLDVAIELAGVGEHEAALACLAEAEGREGHRPAGQPAVRPLLAYHRAHVLRLAGRPSDAAVERARARTIDATWCFPGRLADAAVLREAADADPGDARARSLLGHWTYAAGRRADALALWRDAVALDPDDAVAWRNIGLAAVNHERDLTAARDAYDRACAVAPGDARLLYERDQLAALTGTSPADRLDALLGGGGQEAAALDRDDLAVETLHLMITEGRADQALTILGRRRLHPWEGGEGQALLAWDRAHAHRALDALAGGRPRDAVGHVRAALAPPRSLGEARHPLASTAYLHLLLGDALAAAGRAGDGDGARGDGNGEAAGATAADAWRTAAAQRGDFVVRRSSCNDLIGCADITIDNASSIRRNIYTSIDPWVPCDRFASPAVLVLIIIDPYPGSAFIIGPINSSYTGDLRACIQGRVCLCRRSLAKPDVIGFFHSSDLVKRCS
jgi:tetratricopeptide (TPR) repeat protein